jgi:2-dehydropantoate 2-reductase
MTSSQPPLLIVGTGAMACLFAARLSAAGIPVAMLGTWREGLHELSNQGVTLVEADGSQHTYPVQATDDPAQHRGARFALVLVKSWQTRRAASQLKECLDEEGVALTLQNGVGNREILVEVLGAPRVALGVTTLGANLLQPGRVQAAGEGVTSIGVHYGLDPLIAILRAAGFTVEDAPDPDVLLWGKLVINAAINPLTAILRVNNGELLNRPTGRSLMVSLAREAAAVAAAQKLRLNYDDPITAVEETAMRTAANHSSMLQDIQRGTPTEIDAICGAIVRAGEQTDVPTPVNYLIWQLVKALSPTTSGNS